jgi:hypothetical protein
MDELKKYFAIANKLRSGKEVGTKDIEFFLSYTPEVDEAKMQTLVDGGEFASFEDAQGAMIEAGRALQSSPEYKTKTLEIAKQAESSRISDKLATGINLVLGGTDIAASINQIRSSESALKKSRKPARPAVPQRDLYLQQALRTSQEGSFDAARAMAPVQAEIQDQYLSDIQGAKTASAGQAGAYGAYRQLAANRRNRSALDLAPIQDSIRAREQQRYDNLLGMRQNETQQMFQNNAGLYETDLRQYNNEQLAAGQLGSTGRQNLRDSLYNMGGQAADYIGSNYAQRRYRNLENQAIASGIDPKYVVGAEKNIRKIYENENRPAYMPQYYEQAYIGG